MISCTSDFAKSSRFLLLLLLLVAGGGGCAAHKEEALLSPPDSGFLNDYSLLSPSDQYDKVFVYRNPEQQVSLFKMIMLDPVQVLVKGEKELPLTEKQAQAKQLEQQIVAGFGKSFPVVRQAGFGVLRIRSAITQVAPSAPTAAEVEFLNSQNGETVVAIVILEQGGGRPALSVMLSDAVNSARGFHTNSELKAWNKTFPYTK
jgi:hypothetical protein